MKKARLPRIFRRFTAQRFAISVAVMVLSLQCMHLGHGASLPPGFVDTDVTGYWDGVAGLLFDGGGRMYAWERAGRVWIFENDARLPTPLIDISDEVGAWDDLGMLSVALHPDFSQNGYIYLFYVVDHHHLKYYGTPNYDPNADEYHQATIGRITRYTARASDNFRSVDPASRTVLLGESASSGIPLTFNTHGTGTLLFGTDGMLLASCGDGAHISDEGSNPLTYYQQALNEGILRPAENVGAFRSQMVNSLSGKVLRLDPLTGNGVSSNPFYDPANPRAPRSRVWVLGLRQPFRMTLRPGTGSHDAADGDPGVLYVGDVGYDTWEEMSVVTGPGLNFGWPIFEGLEEGPNYLARNPANQDAPNPLFGTGGCTEQYFTFRDLLKQATLATPSWPNPCAPDQQVPSSIPHFLHTRPVLDWKHGVGPSRTGTYSGTEAAVINVGAPGSPVQGPQFGGNCSVGGTWYQGNNFPASYKNTYFHADLGNQWIKNFTFDANNNPVSVRDFATSAGGVVCLAENPLDGSLYYIDFYSGIRKISYGGNQPPTAVASSDVNYGPTPLTVHFRGSGSSDPEGFPLLYSWDFGDGTPPSVQADPTHVFYALPGIPTLYVVRLTVTDAGGLSSQASLNISLNNTPPSVTITSPARGTKYPMTGDTVYSLRADVRDSEQSDGHLLYQWEKILHHNNHEHPNPVDTNHVTSTVLSPIGCDGNLYYYRIILTVTDSAGLSSQDEVDVYPDCSNTPPQISDLPDQTIDCNGSTGAIPFLIGDAETPASSLTLTGSSSNPTLVPNSNILFGGTDSNRTVTITPASNQSGTATITVSVSDGSLNASDSLVLTVNSTNSPPTTNGPTYLLTEDFEGTGFENSDWINHGASNPDYTNKVLHGTQSLNCLGLQYIEHPFIFTNSFYLYFQVRWNTWTDYNNIIYWDDPAWQVVAGLYADHNRLELDHGSAYTFGTTTIVADTTYHVWVEWTKGIGGNATMKLFVSTTGAKPPTPEANITSGNGGATQRIYIGPTSPGPNVIFDRILVDDEPIGSNP